VFSGDLFALTITVFKTNTADNVATLLTAVAFLGTGLMSVGVSLDQSAVVTFSLNVRKTACPATALASPTTMFSFADQLATAVSFGTKCTAIASSALASGTAADISAASSTYTTGNTALDNAAAAVYNKYSTFEAVYDATRAARQDLRGNYKVSIPANAFVSVSTVTFGATPVLGENIARLPALPHVTYEADSTLGLKLTPAGQLFVKDVDMCINIGDAPAGYSYALFVTSQNDANDETMGYAPWTPVNNQVYYGIQGRICGTVNHFSVVMPVRIPFTAPATPSATESVQCVVRTAERRRADRRHCGRHHKRLGTYATSPPSCPTPSVTCNISSTMSVSLSTTPSATFTPSFTPSPSST
jgi:hypothetical protein